MSSNTNHEAYTDGSRVVSLVGKVAAGVATFLGVEAAVQDMGLERPVAAVVAGIAAVAVEAIALRKSE